MQPVSLQRGSQRYNIFIFVAKLGSGGQHRRQIHPDFFLPAAGQQRNPLFRNVKIILGSKLQACDRRFRSISEWMSDIADVNSMLPVEVLLEGKDHNHLADIFADLLHPAGTPRPDLRAYKVKNRDTRFVKLTGQTQVEVRKINEDGGIGPTLFSFSHKLVEFFPNLREMSKDFSQAHHRHFIGMD